jgi:hypothetical protein
MPVLICQPVSQRSEPQKIQRWISHLEQMRRQYQDDTDALDTIERFLSKAQRWGVTKPPKSTDS